jgi:hypothetical protein
MSRLPGDPGGLEENLGSLHAMLAGYQPRASQ